MTCKQFLENLNSPKFRELLFSLYGADQVDTMRQRYSRLAEELLNDEIFSRAEYPEASGDVRIFSVPGRTEFGGNHTDHNDGRVLVASVHMDSVTFAAKRSDKHVYFRSAGHREIKVDLSDLSVREEEKGDTEALVRGVAAEMTAQGTPVGGFTANASNILPSGAGLSSSAAVEVLFAKIFDNLYCGGKRSTLELAKIAQKAENVYFGKPCGLMDQLACASGGVIAIDFAGLSGNSHSLDPAIKGVTLDLAATGLALCMVNTKGRHSELIPEYAAIPEEMKAAAAVFGKDVLGDVDEGMFFERIADVRQAAGDRAVLRAMHFFNENRRVDAMLAALKNLNALSEARTPPEAREQPEAMKAFLSLVRESGDSSQELLQNIHSPRNPREQGMSLALALTKKFLAGEGACRVHGGGFAGAIQVYLPLQRMDEYRNLMEGIFGKGAVTVLRMRPFGAMELQITA